jgi:polyphosphate kinase 2 (PPK2 family)
VVALRAEEQDTVFDDSGSSFRRGLAAMQAGSADLPSRDGAPRSNGSDVATLPEGRGAHQPPATLQHPAPGILRRVDLAQKLNEKSYERTLARLQAKLHLLGFQVYRQQRPVVLIFEGWDAAGKGGTIQRITEKLDPRGYVVHAIAAPAGDDKAHHYLYRFWRRLPPCGMIAIFDRSWYGRVLVERVEGFAREDEWQRAYAEINEFE